MQPSSFINSTWTRDQLLNLLNTALTVGEKKYARQVAVMWLSTYPGDLQVRLFHARSLLDENNHIRKEQALQILEEICSYDPEFVEAQKYLAQIQRELGVNGADNTTSCVIALGGATPRQAHGVSRHPEWALQLRETRRLLLNQKKSTSSKTIRNLERVETLIHQVLVANPDLPLAAVTHLRVIQSLGTMPDQAVNSVAKAYLSRWPNCLPIMLIYAQTMMESSDSTVAVALLHRAVSMDVTGQVPRRIWDDDHPYRVLWPDTLQIAPSTQNSPQNLPIPAAVAAVYGWNRLALRTSSISEESDNPPLQHLPPAEIQINLPTSEHPRGLRQIKAATKANREGRFPIYVIFSTRHGLKQHYGADNLPKIEDALRELVSAVRGRRIGHQNWGAILYFADDVNTASSLGIKPARHNDPWSLKLALRDLDSALGKRGERIGALLIVGGHEIVPFHHLPNPVDDIDRDVPSDNPYATRDENYFVLEWPVGRLPAGSDTNPAYLLRLINAITHQHKHAARVEPWYQSWWKNLINKLKRKHKRSSENIGYSAAVWRRASLAVYRAIGDPRSLMISPPVQACEISPSGNMMPARTQSTNPQKSSSTATCIILPTAQFGYFNLHGLSDASEWYGQRDPTDISEGPDFPIALRPQDIRNSGEAPRVVFSEACYGAFIHGKRAEEAIAIKFLTSGTLAVVGSTCTCYGSISSPLIAADLLGRVYWGMISEGHLAGEALRRAKLYLAKEMHHRQGFLDGEDQKTLISFVLYGDPLAHPYPRSPRHTLSKAAPELPHQLLTVSDQQSIPLQETPSVEITAHVKQVVQQYLPGMSDANATLNQTGSFSQTSTQSSISFQRTNKNLVNAQGRQVVILSKNIEQASLQHPQLARLTLDKTGKVIKLVVSR